MPLQDLALTLGALGAVLAVIWLGQALIRRGAIALPGAARPGASRLRLVQTLPVDRHRRLLLLACDEAEYVVLAGGPSDLLLDRKPVEAAR